MRAAREVEPRDEEAESISPEQMRFQIQSAISKAMSKELAPLLARRDLAQTRPNVYRGSKDGSIDGWILIMQRYLKRIQAKVSAGDRAWSIIGHLQGEARNYIINKAESERDTPEKVFELLSSRFGAGGNRMQVRQAFQGRVQQEKEDCMQYLDALEGLRSQGFPQDTITTKRYEILAALYGRCAGSSIEAGTCHSVRLGSLSDRTTYGGVPALHHPPTTAQSPETYATPTTTLRS